MATIMEVLRGFARTVRSHGGILKSIQDLYRTDMLKFGRLVGVDEDGNRYYENKSYYLGRDRWVIFADRVGLDYDATQIPPEWHGWIHHTYEDPPQGPPRPYKWMKKHQENQSGTRGAYVP